MYLLGLTKKHNSLDSNDGIIAEPFRLGLVLTLFDLKGPLKERTKLQ